MTFFLELLTENFLLRAYFSRTLFQKNSPGSGGSNEENGNTTVAGNAEFKDFLEYLTYGDTETEEIANTDYG